MKRTYFGFAMMALSALAGCTQGTPGGPGTTSTTAKRPTYGQADDTFNLTVPTLSSAVQQGNQIETTIGIKRAKNFDEDVSLKFADVPKGVTIDPANPVIKHGDTETKVSIKAGDEARAGEFKVKITGHPTKGGDAHIEFKLAVAPKDSFTLSFPRPSTSLHQGETQTVSIGIKRDKSFDKSVSLEFGEMPTGVTLEPKTLVLEPGDTEGQLTLTAMDDAALGKFTIQVTGHPTQGADASGEFNLTVVKK